MKLCDICGEREATCFIIGKDNKPKYSLCIDCYKTPDVKNVKDI